MDSHEDQRIAEFLALHHAIAWKIARSFSNDDADCNDLFQEICISIWTAFDSIPDEVRDTTYVYRVALNRAISWRRKRESYLGHLRAYLLRNQSNAIACEHAPHDETEELYAAIQKLSDSDRSLILMYLDELGYDAMAEILGAKPTAVRKRVSRVKRRLADIIKSEENQHES